MSPEHKVGGSNPSGRATFLNNEWGAAGPIEFVPPPYRAALVAAT